MHILFINSLDKFYYPFTKQLVSLFLGILAIVSPSPLFFFLIVSTFLISKHLIRDRKKTPTAQLTPCTSFPFHERLSAVAPQIRLHPTLLPSLRSLQEIFFFFFGQVCSCTQFEYTILLDSPLSSFLSMKCGLIVCRPFNTNSSQSMTILLLFSTILVYQCILNQNLVCFSMLHK